MSTPAWRKVIFKGIGQSHTFVLHFENWVLASPLCQNMQRQHSCRWGKNTLITGSTLLKILPLITMSPVNVLQRQQSLNKGYMELQNLTNNFNLTQLCLQHFVNILIWIENVIAHIDHCDLFYRLRRSTWTSMMMTLIQATDYLW